MSLVKERFDTGQSFKTPKQSKEAQETMISSTDDILDGVDSITQMRLRRIFYLRGWIHML